jgi:hypothetical protein
MIFMVIKIIHFFGHDMLYYYVKGLNNYCIGYFLLKVFQIL